MQKWLTREEGWRITGQEDLGGTLFFYFGPDYHHEMEILKLDPDKEVTWKCTVGHPDWIGTTVDFAIEDKGKKSTLHFEHNGWAIQTDFFYECVDAWTESLANIKKAAESEKSLSAK